MAQGDVILQINDTKLKDYTNAMLLLENSTFPFSITFRKRKKKDEISVLFTSKPLGFGLTIGNTRVCEVAKLTNHALEYKGIREGMCKHEFTGKS